MAFLFDSILPLADLEQSVDWGRKEEGSKQSQELRTVFLFLGHLVNVPSSCLYFIFMFFLVKQGKYEVTSKGKKRAGKGRVRR